MSWLIDLGISAGGSLIGTLVGAVLGYIVARWQFKKQQEAEKQQQKLILQIYYEKVRRDLRDNKNVTVQLKEILGECNEARVDIWEWAGTIVDSYAVQSYYALINSGVAHLLPEVVLKEINASYGMIIELTNQVKQGIKAQEFYYGYRGDRNAANKMFENVKIYCNTVQEHLEYAMSIINKEN